MSERDIRFSGTITSNSRIKSINYFIINHFIPIAFGSACTSSKRD